MTLLFGIAHLAICLIYAKISNTKMQELIFTFIFTLFIPVLGIIVLMVSNRKGSSEEHVSEIEHAFQAHEPDENRKIFINQINMNNELNQISIEEALNVGSYETRRKMIMDTLQSDNIIEYLGSLKEALLNEDVETVHYASSVIMEIQKKINDAVITMKTKYKRDPENEQNIEEFEAALEKIIFSGAYDDRNLTKYYDEYIRLSDEILDGEDIDEKYYYNRIRVDFKLENFTHAEQVCKMYRTDYPKSENMITSNMKYYVMTYNKPGLEAFVNSLENSEVYLKDDSLDYIKFFG